MTVFYFELKKLKNSVFIWSICLGVGLFFYMAFFPVFATDSAAMMEVLDSYPEEFLAFFGMNTNLPFTELMGYFALTYTFLMIPIAIQSANYGIHILSVEERELTADFLLTKPITRSVLYRAKILSSVVGILFTDLVLFGLSFVSLYMFKNEGTVDVKGTVVFLLSLILFQLFFFSTGLLVSMLVKKVSSVLAYSMSLGFGFYILSSLGMMIGSDVLKILSPFTHFDPNYALVHQDIRYGYVLISVVVIIVSFVVSYLLYLKRNIKSL